MFYNYFRKQNNAILNGSVPGYPLDMGTLGIINGCINSKIEVPHYPEMAVNNTYGIKGINESIYTFTKQAWSLPGGCRDMLDECAKDLKKEPTADNTFSTCSTSLSVCGTFVAGPYYDFSKRDPYDMRVDENYTTPSKSIKLKAQEHL